LRLTRLAIRNAQFVLIVLLILTFLGVRSFIDMPRSEDPQADFPIYNILAVYPGTSPEDIEKLIVDPLEEVLNEIDDIRNFKSNIRDGVGRIGVNASYDIDPDEKYDEILREINLVRPSLPDGIVLFDVEQIKPADRVNFKVYALTSDVASYSALMDLAEELEGIIEGVDGVSSVDIDAGQDDEIQVLLDYERMAAQNISLGQVIAILNANNANIPGGDIDLGNLNFSLKSTGDYKDLEEIRRTVISADGQRMIQLQDIAEVRVTKGDVLWQGSYMKQKCVFVGAKLKRGYNILTVDKAVESVAGVFASELPATVTLNTSFEQAPAVQTKINDFFINLLQGVGLVGLIILLFLGWRAAIIIVTLIPLCIVLAMALLSSAGYGLQQISIASLVLALGLLVDNGIVVIENISRMIKEGLAKKQAAIAGAEEVGLAIASSTVTTLLSFFPLTQLGEGAGLFLMSLPLTVIFTLIISLILALSFSPILSNWIMTDKISKPSWADRFFHFMSFRLYRPVLSFSLQYGIVIIAVAIFFTGLSVSLFPKIGVSFFPTADKPLLLIDVDTPKGSGIDYTRRSTDFVEGLLDTMDIVSEYTTSVGNSNPQIYYNRIPKSFVKSHGQVQATLRGFDPESFYKTIASLRNAFKEWPEAEITVEELKNGAPVDAPIEIRVFGDDLDILKGLTSQVEEILQRTEDVININNPLTRNKTELSFILDKEKAGLLGISELDFDRTIRASFNGLVIGETTLSDDETYEMVVKMPYFTRPNIDDFYKIYVTNRMGRSMPLHHVSSIQFSSSPAAFSHYDTDRYVAVTGSLANLDLTIAKTLSVMGELDKMDWPSGYHYVPGGEYEEQQATFGSLGVILILAQIGIFAVLVLQFRSILQPLIVFMAIPLAAGGSFIALYLTGWPFSFFAFVGLISLIGIVVNNSIILVDHINQLRQEEDISMIDAIVEGSIRRFKPIILTTLTTILGLLPLTLQATNQWSPLCWTIIGGMISSTVLTLLVIPVLYKWLGRWKKVDAVTSSANY